MRDGEDYEQKKSTRKGQILGMMEEMYSGREYVGEQRKSEEYNRVG